jgi:hypothetical protein
LGAAVPTLALIYLDAAGIGIVNLIVGALVFLIIHLTLVPITGALNKWDVSYLRPILCRTRIAATFANPILGYEARLLQVTTPD